MKWCGLDKVHSAFSHFALNAKENTNSTTKKIKFNFHELSNQFFFFFPTLLRQSNSEIHQHKHSFMANLTSNLSPFKPLVSPTTQPPSLSLSNSSKFLKFNPINFVSSVSPRLITARYGRSSFNRSRDNKKNEPEAEPALDISTIRSATVRLIDADQNMVGIVSKSEAMQIADDADLDLVILSPEADPPVLKIMDYNKYKYEQQRKKKEQLKKSTATRVDMKELKMGYNIDVHDYSVRLRAAQKFLNDGDKVKVIVQLKGRENEFRNSAIELIKRFQADIGELATEESKNFRERNIFIVLLPNKEIRQRGQEPPKKREKPPVTEVSASV